MDTDDTDYTEEIYLLEINEDGGDFLNTTPAKGIRIKPWQSFSEYFLVFRRTDRRQLPFRLNGERMDGKARWLHSVHENANG